MIDFIWGIMISIGIIVSLFTGNIANLNNTINETIKNSINIVFNMVGTICFWSGIINITLNTKIKSKIFKVLQPLIDVIFPKLKRNKEIKEKIATVMTLNILGVANASTTIGMDIIKELENKNDKNEISDEVFLFIIINTVSIQLIPNNIIALRNAYNSNDVNKIIFPIISISVITFAIIIIVSKLYLKIRRRNKYV